MIPQCLQATENCGLPVYRGLCHRHYRQLASLVRRGKTTWAKAETAGLCAAQKRGKDGLTPASRNRWAEAKRHN